MKLITLNLWGGRVKEPLVKFVEKWRAEVDLFCFQEVFHDAAQKTRGNFDGAYLDLYTHFQSLLPDHQGYFCPTVDDYYGIATFVRKNLTVPVSGELSIYDNPAYSGRRGEHGRKMLWLELKNGDSLPGGLSLMNVHGLWTGQGKADTPERLEQSRRIKVFMDSISLPKILCGDFNLSPSTESVAILEQGMKNLIKDYGVTSTRTPLYTRATVGGQFADYIFTSPEIKVIDFKVLPDEVSDHAPLYLEFSI